MADSSDIDSTPMRSFRAYGLGWLKNQANQISIKLALAGCLALFLTQFLALYHPVWSIVTVIMLSLPMYVGAVAEKALFRAIGTVIGGFLAVFIVGNFANTPIVLLIFSGLVILVCTYFNGGTRAPYAFFLTALTMVVVMARTVQTPQIVWETAMARMEEILLGIFCSLVVVVALWPRYARDDFATKAREAIRELIRVQARLFGSNPVSIGDQPESSLVGLTQKMRGLIQLGGRESSYFRANSEIMVQVVNSTSMLNQLMLEVASVREKNPEVHFPPDLFGGFLDCWRKILQDLAGENWEAAEEGMGALRECGKRLDDFLERTRDEVQDRAAGPQRVLLVAVLILSLKDMIRYTEQLFQTLPHLHGDRGNFPWQIKNHSQTAAPIDGNWIKNGIRAALAVGASLVFCQWIQPPGSSLIPVFAFLFPVLSRNYLSADGDLGVFTALVRAAVFGLPWALFVFLISPILTNYLWMNLFLGLCLIGFGRMVYSGLPALTLNGLLVLNGIVSTFALNFQEPVTFFDISNNYLGFVLGIGFAAVFQRLVWPVLPQREFRDRCKDTLRILQRLLSSSKRTENVEQSRTEILKQISEMNRWIKTIPPALGGKAEAHLREEMVFLLRRLARVSLRTVELSHRLVPWQAGGEEMVECMKTLRLKVADQCGLLARCLLHGRHPEKSNITSLMVPQLNKFEGSIFSKDRPPKISREDWLGWMSLIVRHQMLAERADALTQKMRSVDLQCLGKDPVL